MKETPPFHPEPSLLQGLVCPVHKNVQCHWAPRDPALVVLNSKHKREQASFHTQLAATGHKTLLLISSVPPQEEALHCSCLRGHGFLTGILGLLALPLHSLTLTAVSFSCFLSFVLFAFPTPPPASMSSIVCSRKGRWRPV